MESQNHSRGTPGMTWPPTLPFEQALDRARAADSYALSLLYRRFLPVVYRYTLAQVADPHIAEDLTSETFFAVVEGIRQARARDELSFAAWVLGIARRRVALRLRQTRSRPSASLNALEDGPAYAATIVAGADQGDPLRIITARESVSEVVNALNRLTEEQRAVVLYRGVLGYSVEEVAQLLGKQPGAVRALQFRALASLARLLNSADTGARASHAAPDNTMRGSDERRPR